ncbi:hypothetical protein BGZ99_001989 [Dissophora globulifera]|uniref:Nuclear speckle splicing regulatory protein 1 N-terminal domain-containing protein n=1 Tax=Dissophora globulifera TaxID=979702 RepID=A0A9P6RQ41_9FUNG|nr:hypothetical protein BGZ99_001989 [Dissophora globulifera]
MSGLQFGLNIKKKGPALAKPRPAASRPIGGRSAFGDHSDDNLDDDDDDDDNDSGSNTPFSSSSRPKPSLSSSISSTSAVNKALRPYATATLQSTAVIEQQNAALAEDATAFDYDGVYDQLKAGDRARELARKKDSAERKPKYVAALLQAAETRKRDRQIAEEKRLERERQKEGDEFKDKEMFITPAYKAQKEAMRLAEEEDRKREEMLTKDSDGSLMQGFYRTMLEERTRLREAGSDPTAGLSAEEVKALEEDQRRKEQEDQELTKEAREHGLLNENGQVVDRRMLLKGGLNIVKKKSATASLPSSSRSSRDSQHGSYDRDRAYAAYKDAKHRSTSSSSSVDPSADQRARMTEQIERQLMEQKEKEEEEEKKRQDSIREALKRKNQDDQVMDAKARYLARKAAVAAAKASS